MRIDLSRVAASAIDAALDDGKQSQRRLTAPKAIAAGAALALAARYAVTKAPHIPRIPGLSDLSSVPDRLRDHLPDDLRDKLADRGWLDDEDGARLDEEGFDVTNEDDDGARPDEEDFDLEDDDELDEGDDDGEPPDDEDDGGGGPEPGDDAFADESDEDVSDESDRDALADKPEDDEESEAEEDGEPEPDEDEDEAEEDQDEPDEDEAEEDPRDLFAEDPDEDEQPEADASEDVRLDLFADEPVDATDAGSDRYLAATDEAAGPSVMDVLSRHRRQRPVLTRRQRPRRRPRGVDPAELPPRPPKRTSGDKSSKGKARKR